MRSIVAERVDVVSCLKRKSIVFNPSVEPEIYLNRDEVKKWIQKLLTRWLPMNIKIVALFYGDDGGGKTHFLKHVQWHLAKIGEPLVGYVDLRRLTSEFDFYLRIVDALSRCGFLEDLLQEILSLKDSASINQLTGGWRLSWIARQLGFDPDQLSLWIYGRLPRERGRWIHSVERDVNISRATLSELLKAFYVMRNRHYPVFLIDHVEDILSEAPKNYMSKPAKEETIKLLRAIGEYSNVLLTIDNQSHSTYRRYFSEFKSSQYSEIRLSYLRDDALENFFSDLRDHIVDTQRLHQIDLDSMSDKESVSVSSYPLTEECVRFIRKLNTMQPGTILRALNHALAESEERTGKEMITRSLFEKAIRNLDPCCLVVCEKCQLKLSYMSIGLRTRYNKPSTVLNVSCPICNSSTEKLLPLVLDCIVVDTSALANLCVSAVFDYLPSLGTSRRVNIYIPKAVRGELAGWEKRMEKRSASRSALYELQRINSLRRRGNVGIEENVGREPRMRDKSMARFTDSIDKIIMETAESLNGTIFTSDKLMAEDGGATGVFSLLFSVRSGSREDARSSRYSIGKGGNEW